MKNRFTLVLMLCIFISTVKAQNNDTIGYTKLVFSLPVFDFPYQLDAAKTVNGGQASVGAFVKGYSNPSMHLSLDLATNLYTGAHWGIKKLFKADSPNNTMKNWSFGKRLLYHTTLFGSDLVLIYAPGFNGWVHEEFHRSVMTRFRVNSFNDMNKFPLGAELINVSHVADNDLIRFKRESPSDFIRAHVAGIEGEYLLIDKLQRNNFFYNQNLPHTFLYLFSTLNAISYVQICSNAELANPTTDDANTKEKTISVRDFMGLDFSAWVYDLFRPNEPYTARGTHPSGNGIDRYIKTTDLTSEELAYLKKQGNLQWLNGISPMLFGINRIKLFNSGFYGNFSVHHYLTSFGNDITGSILLMNPQYKLHFAYHSYKNYIRSFPSIEAQVIDFEKVIKSMPFYFSPRVLIGMQPKNQGFKTNNSAFLGLAECKIELKTKRIINPYIEVSTKSKGWIAGNEFLNENFSCRVGIVSRFNAKK